MTASLSIATAKPRTSRTFKVQGFNLRGAKGQRARHDNYDPPRYRDIVSPAERTTLRDYDAIAESLTADPLVLPTTRRRTGAAVPSRLAYTTESSGFKCIPGTRTRTRNVVTTKRVVPVIPEPPQFDAAGRRIVYVNTYDAWNLRVRR